MSERSGLFREEDLVLVHHAVGDRYRCIVCGLEVAVVTAAEPTHEGSHQVPWHCGEVMPPVNRTKPEPGPAPAEA